MNFPAAPSARRRRRSGPFRRGMRAPRARTAAILRELRPRRFPHYSGTLPGSADMSVGQQREYLYVLTQWGMGRASLADPAQPGPHVSDRHRQRGRLGQRRHHPDPLRLPPGRQPHGRRGGSGTGPPAMISDWQPFKQGGGDSGLGAQLAEDLGRRGGRLRQTRSTSPRTCRSASRIAAIYLDPSSKYFGYFPTSGNNVQKVDLTNPNGSPDPGEALQPTAAIGWASDSSTDGVRLRAMHVATSRLRPVPPRRRDAKSDMTLHVAEINPSAGKPDRGRQRQPRRAGRSSSTSASSTARSSSRRPRASPA